MEPRLTILSASACTALKKCPIKYRNACVYGLRQSVEPDPLRVGSNWHAGLEAMSLKPEQPCPFCSKQMYPDADCPYCRGTGFVDDPLEALARVLNLRYGTLYPGMSYADREVERITLLYSLLAYNLQWNDDGVQVIAREIPFRIPLIDPQTRKAIPDVFIDGMIDKLVLHNGHVTIMEHKSTSDSVEPESDYWSHLRLDLQTTLYPYAVQRLQADELLEPYGIKAGDPPISDVLYDVWRKPQIAPKKLSQADTTEFLASRQYLGRLFEVDQISDGAETRVSVDGSQIEVEPLKKGFAIRETPEMFGCRLFADYAERPDYYFARHPISRSSVDMERFEHELFALYKTIAAMKETDSWYHNEHACEDHGRCEYRQFCYSGTELDPANPPAGFVNIFQKKGT